MEGVEGIEETPKPKKTSWKTTLAQAANDMCAYLPVVPGSFSFDEHKGLEFALEVRPLFSICDLERSRVMPSMSSPLQSY